MMKCADRKQITGAIGRVGNVDLIFYRCICNLVLQHSYLSWYHTFSGGRFVTLMEKSSTKWYLLYSRHMGSSLLRAGSIRRTYLQYRMSLATEHGYGKPWEECTYQSDTAGNKLHTVVE